MEPSHYLHNFAQYFPDADLNSLDISTHQIFIIERLLSFGDHRALRWVLDTYSEREIEKTIIASRNLDCKTASYWQQYFGLDKEEMRCFAKPLQQNSEVF